MSKKINFHTEVKKVIHGMNNYKYLDANTLPTEGEKIERIEEINTLIKENVTSLPLLYRYTKLDFNTLSNINENGRVYLVQANKMNDVFEGAICDRQGKNPNGIIENFQSNIYLKCFSESYKNILMWSMYGDDSKGICIEYNFKKYPDALILNYLYPVEYNKERFISNSIDKLKNNIYFFLRKSTEWKHEKEWRIIFKRFFSNNLQKIKEYVSSDFYEKTLDEPNGSALFPEAIPIDLKCVKSITFGERVGEQEIKAVKSLLQDKVRYYRIFKKNNTFDLERKLVKEEK